MNIQLEALDTLFFRDAKAFTAGQDAAAQSLFPPSPTTLYGACQTWLAAQNPDFQAYIQALKDEQGNWTEAAAQVQASYYRITRKEKEGFYFPLPLDMLIAKNELPQKGFFSCEALQLKAQDSFFASSYKQPYYLAPKEGKELENLEQGICSEGELLRYLRGGQESSIKALALQDFVKSEPKLGIARDKERNAVQESMLYSIEMKRLEHIRFCIELAGEEQPENPLPLLKLGGEGKGVKVYSNEKKAKIERIKALQLDSQLDGKQVFKIYLASPALFKKGWQPDIEQWLPDAKLLAAAIGKALSIGGFDLQKKRPKTKLKAVPAGSVYFYSTEKSHEQVQEALLAQDSISDFNAKEGFGLFFLGNV